MTPLWDRLNDYAAHIRGKFQDNFTEYDEPAMADLHFKDWDDRFWHSDQVDKKMSKFISDKLNVSIEEAKKIQKKELVSFIL